MTPDDVHSVNISYMYVCFYAYSTFYMYVQAQGSEILHFSWYTV